MACPDLEYSEFTDELVAGLADKRVPLNAAIELTERCNLRCVHCYIHDPARDREVRDRELTTEQWCHIFDQLAEAGCLWMLWTGGEILVRQDFQELYRYAKGKGFLITLFTNGTLLTRDLVQFLEEWPPLLVEVSMYGMTPKTYGQVTGVPAALDNCLRGIEWLVESGLPLRLKTMALTLTRQELGMMYAFARERGVPFRHDAMLWQTFHGHDVRGLRLAPEEAVSLDSYVPATDDDYHRVHDRTQRVFKAEPGFRETYLFTCGAALRSFHIDPYGQLTVCSMTRAPAHDLLAGSFREGWETLGEWRSVQTSNDFACLHCDLSAGICQRCPAFSFHENGDPETVVEYACAIAHLRAERLGLKSGLQERGVAIPAFRPLDAEERRKTR